MGCYFNNHQHRQKKEFHSIGFRLFATNFWRTDQRTYSLQKQKSYYTWCYGYNENWSVLILKLPKYQYGE
jgi:hypothetical protein